MVEEPVEPEQKPFRLPDIEEPIPLAIPVVEGEIEVVTIPLAEEVLPEAEPVGTGETLLQQAGRVSVLAGTEMIRKVAPDYCEDLTCSQVDLFRPAAPLVAAVGWCHFYTFGGYMFVIDCAEVWLIFLALLLLLLAPFPFGIWYVHKAVRQFRRDGKRRRVRI